MRKALTALVVVGALVALFAGVALRSSPPAEVVSEITVSSSSTPTDSSNGSSTAASAGWEAEALAALQDSGPEAAIRGYDAAAASDSQLQSSCHHAYRFIGEQAAMLYGNVEYRTYDCESGFVHGLMRELGKKYNSAGDYVSEIGKNCRGLQGENRLSCYHGLGHGAALADHNDLQAAVRACEGTEDRESLQQCALAVFMEFGDNALGGSIWETTSFPPSHSNEAWDTETGERATTIDQVDPESLCLSVSEAVVPTCYFNLWKFVAAPFKGPIQGDEGFKWTARYCSALAEDHYEQSCATGFASLGISILGETGEITRDEWPPTTPTAAEHLAQVLVKYCRSSGSFGACLDGVVPASTSYLYNSGWEDENIPQFCEYAQSATELQACEQAVRIAKSVR